MYLIVHQDSDNVVNSYKVDTLEEAFKKYEQLKVEVMGENYEDYEVTEQLYDLFNLPHLAGGFDRYSFNIGVFAI